MKSKVIHKKLFIKIIALAVTIVFLCQNIVWAMPNFFTSAEWRVTSNKLAPPSDEKNKYKDEIKACEAIQYQGKKTDAKTSEPEKEAKFAEDGKKEDLVAQLLPLTEEDLQNTVLRPLIAHPDIDFIQTKFEKLKKSVKGTPYEKILWHNTNVSSFDGIKDKGLIREEYSEKIYFQYYNFVEEEYQIGMLNELAIAVLEDNGTYGSFTMPTHGVVIFPSDKSDLTLGLSVRHIAYGGKDIDKKHFRYIDLSVPREDVDNFVEEYLKHHPDLEDLYSQREYLGILYLKTVWLDRLTAFFEAAKAEDAKVPTGYEKFPSTSTFIIRNEDLNIEGLNKIRGTKNVIIVDNNPFKGKTKEQIAEEMEKNPWLSVIDHHDAYDDGEEKPSFTRIMDWMKTPEGQKQFASVKDGKTVVLTNAMNLDPDAIWSFFAFQKPELAKDYRELIQESDHFTDFSLFGQETYDENFTVNKLTDAQKLAFIVLQMINEQKKAVCTARGKKPTELTNHDVGKIIQNIINELPDILANIESMENENRYTAYLKRIKAVNRVAKKRTKSLEDTLALGPITEDSPLYALKDDVVVLDNEGKSPLDENEINDWIAESAGRYVSDKPVAIYKNRAGKYAVSIRYGSFARMNAAYDLNPLIKALNAFNENLQEGAPRQLWYGRAEVLFQLGAPITLEILIDKLASVWNEVKKESAKEGKITKVKKVKAQPANKRDVDSSIKSGLKIKVDKLTLGQFRSQVEKEPKDVVEIFLAEKPLIIQHKANNRSEVINAINSDADAIEFDIHVTIDGYPVLIHDPCIRAMPTISLTLKELKKAVPTILTLDEMLKIEGVNNLVLLAHVHKWPDHWWQNITGEKRVEAEDNYDKNAMKIIKSSFERSGLMNNVMFASFDVKQLKLMKEVFPDHPRVLATEKMDKIDKQSPEQKLDALIDEANQAGVTYISIGANLDRRMNEYVKKAGMRVMGCTNSAAEQRGLFEAGACGVIVDNVSEAKKVFNKVRIVLIKKEIEKSPKNFPNDIKKLQLQGKLPTIGGVKTVDEFLKETKGENIPLVLGGSGFIGSHMADKFLAKGEKVAILVRGFDKERLVNNQEQFNNPNFYCVGIDDMFKDAEGLGKMIEHSSVVYDFAADAGAKEIDYRKVVNLFAVNGLLTGLISELAMKYNKKVVYASTGHFLLFVDDQDASVNEQTPLPIKGEVRDWIKQARKDFSEYLTRYIRGEEVTSPFEYVDKYLHRVGSELGDLQGFFGLDQIYGISKVLGEEFVKNSNPGNGVILRFCNVYGPRCSQSDVIGSVTKRLKDGKEISPSTDSRQFIYVRDLTDAVRKAGVKHFNKNEMFLISPTGPAVTMKVLLKEIVNAFSGEARSFEAKPNSRVIIAPPFNSSKAQAVLGLKIRTDLRKGIKETVEWFKKKYGYFEPAKPNIENHMKGSELADRAA